MNQNKKLNEILASKNVELDFFKKVKNKLFRARQLELEIELLNRGLIKSPGNLTAKLVDSFHNKFQFETIQYLIEKYNFNAKDLNRLGYDKILNLNYSKTDPNPIAKFTKTKKEPIIVSASSFSSSDKQTYSQVKGSSFSRATHKLFAELKKREKKGLSVNQPKKIINGKDVYRQLTHMENHIARIDDIPLFENYSDSCTGIVTKANSTLFKVIPASEKLILIPKKFPNNYMSTNYLAVDCEPIDFSKFNQSIWEDKKNLNCMLYTGTRKEREEIFDGVTRKYVEYKEREAGRKFNEKEVTKVLENSFNVHIIQNASKDHVQALYIGSGGNSNAGGGYLYSSARLLLVD